MSHHLFQAVPCATSQGGPSPSCSNPPAPNCQDKPSIPSVFGVPQRSEPSVPGNAFSLPWPRLKVRSCLFAVPGPLPGRCQFRQKGQKPAGNNDVGWPMLKAFNRATGEKHSRKGRKLQTLLPRQPCIFSISGRDLTAFTRQHKLLLSTESPLVGNRLTFPSM